ncbi:MAG TPA: response regulator transcription factor [Chloroflexota bacterium]|nr:response regulator transcription factor [Chloroflexota bacterium]
MSGTRILVVDDEPAIRRTLRANLVARGYDVTTVETGEQALHYATARMPDLVILDLMLPGLSGLEVCRSLRSMGTVPILVLSARGEERTKVQALDLGADDYLTKPFGMDELLARVRALLRRPVMPVDVTTPLEVGPLALHPDTHEVWRAGVLLALTPREFEVLAYLMRHANKVVTHRMLLGEVWGPQYEGETQYLRVFVNRLRRKIEDDPAHPQIIVTEPGVGYRLLPRAAT